MTTFSVWAPAARNVAAVVDGENVELHRGPDDWWRADLEMTHGADYGFRVDDGDVVLPDPRSRWQPAGVHGPSRAYDDDLFTWTDRGWECMPLEGSVVASSGSGTALTACHTIQPSATIGILRPIIR